MDEPLAKLLNTVVDRELPMSAVNVGAAMKTGRRSVRRRRAAGIGGAAISVVAAVAMTATILNTSESKPPIAAGATTTATEVASPSPSPTNSTSSGEQSVQFGWLPAGLDEQAVTMSDGVVEITARSRSSAASPQNYASVQLQQGTVDQPTPGVLVNGHPASWNTDEGAGSWLEWERSPGNLVKVTVAGLPGNAKNTALHIATTLRFEKSDVVFPVRLQGLPIEFARNHAEVTRGSDPRTSWNVRLDFSLPAELMPAASLASKTPALMIHVTAGMPFAPIASTDKYEKITVDGHRAQQFRDDFGVLAVHIFDVNGATVEFVVPEAVLPRIPGGVEGLLRSLEIYKA